MALGAAYLLEGYRRTFYGPVGNSVEQHLTLGYGYTRGDLRFDLAWEHSFTRSQTNTNSDPTENPFGPDSKVTVRSGNVLHLGVN